MALETASSKPALKLNTVDMTQSHSSTSSIHSTPSNESIDSIPSSRTSAQSTQIPQYADEHYPLINTIQPDLIPSHIPSTHSAIHCARIMAQIHNLVIRALNSSYNHCLTIEPNTPSAADFLFFNKMLCTFIDHHHHTEENFLFPDIERLLGRPGAMEENVEGHEKFMAGLDAFTAYVRGTEPAAYNGLVFRQLVEAFAPDLIKHLHEEIPTFTKLYVLDSKELMKAWKVAEHEATKDGGLFTDAPFVLGCVDKAWKVDGVVGRDLGMPWVMERVVEGWCSRRHMGAWRFCPSDFKGRRRVLGGCD